MGEHRRALDQNRRIALPREFLDRAQTAEDRRGFVALAPCRTEERCFRFYLVRQWKEAEESRAEVVLLGNFDWIEVWDAAAYAKAMETLDEGVMAERSRLMWPSTPGPA